MSKNTLPTLSLNTTYISVLSFSASVIYDFTIFITVESEDLISKVDGSGRVFLNFTN